MIRRNANWKPAFTRETRITDQIDPYVSMRVRQTMEKASGTYNT
jgi:hypothetical protein